MCAATSVPSAKVRPLEHCRRRVFYDAHTPDFGDPHQLQGVPDPDFPILSQVDPQADLRVMADAHVDSVVLYAKCQYGNAYYPTEVGYQHSALKGRDLLGEQVAAANDNGMATIAYFSNMWDTRAANANPNWRLVPLEARGPSGRWPALCLRSGYREYALEQAVEIVQNYPVDGFWSDILTAGPCVCERCAAEFQQRTGKEVPQDRRDPAWVDLIRFSADTVSEYLEEQRAALIEANPHVALIPNFFGTTYTDAVLGLEAKQLALADLGSSEGYTDWHGLAFPSYVARYIANAATGKTTEVLVSRFVHTWDSTLRSEAQIRFEAFTVAAHGSAVSLDDQPTATGAIVPEVYRRLEPAYRRVKEREKWLEGARPLASVGIYASQHLREIESKLGGAESASLGEQSAQFPPSVRKEARSDLEAALGGTYRALVESHIPVAFVDEREESLAQLKDLQVLVLPDALYLSPREAGAIKDFVESGGGLVVTGECAVVDAAGAEKEDTDFLEFLGIRYVPGEDSPKYPYIQPRLADIPGVPIPHYGPVHLFEASEEAEILATLTNPIFDTGEQLYWHNNQPAPGEETTQPLIVETTRGDGRIVVSAARIGNNHARLGHAQYRELLEALIDRAGLRDAPITLESPSADTELVLARQRERVIAHLVTGNGGQRLKVVDAPQPEAVNQVARVPSFTLVIHQPHGRVQRVKGEDLEDVRVGEGGRFTIENCDDWETLIVS